MWIIGRASVWYNLVIKELHSCVWEHSLTMVRTFFYIPVSLTIHIPLLFNRIWCEVHYLISEAVRSVDDTPSFNIAVGTPVPSASSYII